MTLTLPITIRTLQADDAQKLLDFELSNRSWFEQHIAPREPSFYTLAGVSEHIETYLAGHTRGTWHPFLLLDDNQTIAGRANLKDIDQRSGCAEVGYRIALNATGKGLATLAIGHLIQSAQNQWGLSKLKAQVSADNPASARVLEKRGFVKTGEVQKLAFIQARWIDGVEYRLDIG